MANVSIDVQPTPNPNALKFNLSVRVVEQGSKSYTSKEAAAESPLARRIFELDGVTSVFMLGNFVTVNKTGSASWVASSVTPSSAIVSSASYATCAVSASPACRPAARSSSALCRRPRVRRTRNSVPSSTVVCSGASVTGRGR